MTKYNEGIYGVADSSTTLIWVLQIAWSGTYNGDNEAMRMVDFTLNRGRNEWVTDSGFGEFDEGEAVCTLLNHDDRYWALNTSSPLYPYVRPGPYARLYVIDGRGGTSYPVMRGFVDNIECYTRDGRKYARLTIKHSRDWLQGKQGTVAYRADTQVDETMADLLENVSWPTSEWADTLTGGTSGFLSYYFPKHVDVISELEALAKIRSNTLICNNVGSMRLLGWNYTQDNTITLTEDKILIDATLGQPWRSLRNAVYVPYYEPVVTSVTDTLWKIDGPHSLPTGEHITFFPTFAYGDYKTVGPTEAVTWHLHVWTEAGGTGTELTSSCTITTYPGDTMVDIANGSASDGYITTLEANVSFNIVQEPTDASNYVSSDSSSIALYGRREMTWDTKYMVQYHQSFADWLVARLKTLQVEPEIQLEARPAEQFGGDLYRDKVVLTLFDISTGNFRIGHIRHEWLSDTGQAVRTTYKLEPYLTAWVPPA